MKSKESKSGRKNSILLIILTLIVIPGIIILLKVSLKVEIDRLSRENFMLQKTLKAKTDETENLSAEAQRLEVEERIVQYAETNLDMVRFSRPHSIIAIDAKQLEYYSKMINSKYE